MGILPIVLEISEWCLDSQLANILKTFWSYLLVFRKGHICKSDHLAFSYVRFGTLNNGDHVVSILMNVSHGRFSRKSDNRSLVIFLISNSVQIENDRSIFQNIIKGNSENDLI